MRILIVHGPNLNLLGERQPEVYGSSKLEQIDDLVRQAAEERGHGVETFQSNHEGELIDRLHSARGAVDGALLNPGALGHYSIALRDAIEAVDFPVVEVHLSNVFAREAFRRRLVVSEVCAGVVSGFGPRSYLVGLDALLRILEGEP